MKMTKMDIILTNIAFELARKNDVVNEVLTDIVDKYGTDIISILIENNIITPKELINFMN